MTGDSLAMEEPVKNVETQPRPHDKTIKVLATKAFVTSILTKSAEELESVISDITSRDWTGASFSFAERSAIRSFGKFAADIKGLAIPSDKTVSHSVALRHILSSSAIIPVISLDQTEIQDGHAVGVRILRRKKVISSLGKGLYHAAEDQIFVKGLWIGPAAFGAIFVSIIMGDKNPGVEAAYRTGLYTPSCISVIDRELKNSIVLFSAALNPLDVSKEDRDKIRGYGSRAMYLDITSDGREKIARLIRCMIIANAYYMSGAAASITGYPGPATLPARAAPPAPARLSTDEAVEFVVRKILAITNPQMIDNNYLLEFESTPLSIIHNANGDDALLYAQIVGQSSAEVERYLAGLVIVDTTHKKLEETRRILAEKNSKAKYILTIIADKFGYNMAEEVVESVVDLSNPELILAYLQPRNRDLVLIDYEVAKHHWSLQADNKCPHVSLLKKLYQSSSYNEAGHILKQLAGFFDRTDKETDEADETGAVTLNNFIMCKSCGFPIMCPHYRVMVQMLSNHDPYDKIRQAMAKYALKYRVEEDMYHFYCRICGARLAETLNTESAGEELGIVGRMDSGLSRIMWGEALKACNLLTFSYPTNPRHFSSVLADTCHPIMVTQEYQILSKYDFSRNGTDEEDTPALVMVLIAIYVYAYIINSVRYTAGKYNEIGIEGVKNGSKISVYAKFVLQHVAKVYDQYISKTTDMSAEYISSKLGRVMMYMFNTGGNVILSYETDPASIVINEIVDIDPIYNYAKNAAVVDGAISPASSAVTRESIREEFGTVVGESLQDLVKTIKDSYLVQGDKSLYTKFYRMTPPSQESAKAFSQLEESDQVYHAVGGKEHSQPHDKARDKQRNKPHDKVHDKQHKSSHNTYFGVHQPRSRNLDFDDIADEYFKKSYKIIIDRANGKDVTKMLEYMLPKEFGIRNRQYLNSARPFHMVKSLQNSKYTVPEGISISYQYDENGDPHKWDIYVFQKDDDSADGDAATREYTISELSTLLAEASRAVTLSAPNEVRPASAPLHGYTLVDVKCSVCKILQKNTAKLSSTVVSKAVISKTKIKEFFDFYETRCPEGNLHTFEADECSKCHITSLFLKHRNSLVGDAQLYYNKYLPKYRQEISSIHETGDIFEEDKGISPALSISSILCNNDAKAVAFARGWKYNYDIVILAANLVSIRPHVIEVLGSMENVDYATIVDGTYTPRPVTSVDSPRIPLIDSMVQQFVRDYNLIKYAYRIFTMPIFPERLKRILIDAGISQDKLESFGKKLPDIVGQYYTNLAIMKRLRRPSDVVKFEIETLCMLTMTAAGLDGTMREFAKKELIHIVSSDKMVTKNDPFNKAIFSDKDVVMDTTLMDDFVGSLPAYIGKTVYDNISYDNIDYDGLNDG